MNSGHSVSWNNPHDGTSPPKRLRTAMSYPRKRAVMACALCRARKTKCDNSRPACGSCSGMGVECNYQQQSDHSSFDQASLLIIEKLNRVLEIIEPASAPNQAQPQASLPLSPHSARTVASLVKATSPASLPVVNGEGSEDTFSEAPRYHVCCETILSWPIFGRDYDFHNESLVYKYGEQDTDESLVEANSEATRNVSRGINEDDFLELVNAFLSNVHTKNPILDPVTLRKSARALAEHGLGWDGPSCLILIACALGAVSRPFKILNQELNRPTCDIVTQWSPDYRRAHAYYLAAMKRIGLLGSSLTGAQCHFFAGVFEMYCSRPLRAWSQFNKAACVLQIYLRLAPKDPETTTSESRLKRGLEQRLYWSCFKSEAELRHEIPLPSSGIEYIRYPHIFPSPPPEPENMESSPGSPAAHFDNVNGWYYYLSEVAACRILNRLMEALYRKDSSWEASEVPKNIRISNELDAQLDVWRDNLPYQLELDADAPHTWEELPFFTWIRYYAIKDLLYRPFLYNAVHVAESDPSFALAAPIVQKAIEFQFFFIRFVCTSHRHHGNWYALRISFGSALQLLALVKSGKFQNELEGRWRLTIDVIMRHLAEWEGEAQDLKGAREIIVSMLEEIGLEC